MDPQKSDESRDRRREEALARRVGEALDQLEHREAGDCPDAELIAAYQEKSLQAEENARCEGHFASCSRCRKILLVLSASAGTPLDEKEVARLGQLVAAERARLEMAQPALDMARPDRIAPRSRWLAPVLAKILPMLAKEAGKPLSKEHADRLGELVTGAPAQQAPLPRPIDSVRSEWRGRWLAPALGLAAVLAVWFAIRPPWRTADQNPAGTLIAQAPKSEPAPSTEAGSREQSAAVDQGKAAKTDREALKNSPAKSGQSSNPPTDALAKNRFESRRANGSDKAPSSVGESILQDEKKGRAESNRGQVTAPAAAPPVAPLPPKAAMTMSREAQLQSAQEAPAASAPLAAAGSVAGNASSPERRAASAPVAAADKVATNADANQPQAGRVFKSLAQMKTSAGDTTLIKTQPGTVSWRIGKGGSIERSTDAGRTWVSQPSPLQEDWIAGAAVSDTVCWIAGRNGAIARTTDGERWQKIAPPPGAVDSSGKFPDWIVIAAPNAQAATVAASDQRRYTTEDGGKTWRAQ